MRRFNALQRTLILCLVPLGASSMPAFSAPAPGFQGLEVPLPPPAPPRIRLSADLSGVNEEEMLALDGQLVPGKVAAPPPARFVAKDGDLGAALECLTAAVYHEARSEAEAGQRAVAQVVLNRVRHPAYPASVCGVVYQGSLRDTGCQFSFTCDGSLSRRRDAEAWSEAQDIAREALSGYVYAPVGYATHYHTTAVSPKWSASLQRLTRLGEHIFYRWRGRAGEPAAFTRTPKSALGGAARPHA